MRASTRREARRPRAEPLPAGGLSWPGAGCSSLVLAASDATAMWRWIDAGVGATMIAIVLVGLASTGTLAQAALIGTRWAAMSVALSPTPVVAPLSTITWAATPDAPSHAAARPPSTTTWVGRRERSEGASDGHARWLKALAEDPHLRAGLNIHEGHICAELKIEPRVAREKLRAAIREPKKYPNLAKAHKPLQPWTWGKGSPAEKEARAALAE